MALKSPRPAGPPPTGGVVARQGRMAHTSRHDRWGARPPGTREGTGAPLAGPRDDHHQPLRDRIAHRGDVALEAVIATYLHDFAPEPSARRHPERIAFALHDQHGHVDCSSSAGVSAARSGGTEREREAEHAVAPVAAAVRQATRAPDERPPA